MAVTVEGVRKSFGDTPALHDVSLAIRPGELIALLGPSGSGKTTLLRILGGLDEPSGGRVLFGDEDALRLSVQERNVGFVFQHYALFRHMTVLDNVAFGLKVRPGGTRPSRRDIRERALNLIRLVQLEGFEKRYPAQLSGGQRQRVALARALAIEPRILLLDEPFGALDAKVRKDLRRWLRELHDQTGHTTVFVTHDQDEALELADRVVVMSNGRIEQVGTPDEIYDEPATAFVAGFIGEASRFVVQVEKGDALLYERPIKLPVEVPRDGRYTVFVRPQDILLGPRSPGDLPGVVRAIRRHGALRRAEIALADGSSVVEADSAALINLRVGQQVGLTFSRVALFPAAEGQR
ncbi:sulfate/molybdate ABC transporter ATP-binding protein [Rhodoligotrophos defluvii]|uniref:sulfate/molybdate ABC transporter ATP-binding protein n=1 Tax=Rhodoligotrophos defluvii TaxID=2561934 RepID=UPI001EEFCEEF|nr:sulfate/molybdate ABC transporter ATP-binding protein [Rhodoligotrophos defluvii]